MIKLKVPTQKRFDLNVSEDGSELYISDVQETAQGYVSFKQATTGEVEVRTGVLQNRRWKQENGSILLFDDFNIDFLARTEVRLTLTGTDVAFEDGTMLDFKDGKVAKVATYRDASHAIRAKKSKKQRVARRVV